MDPNLEYETPPLPEPISPLPEPISPQPIQNPILYSSLDLYSTQENLLQSKTPIHQQKSSPPTSKSLKKKGTNHTKIQSKQTKKKTTTRVYLPEQKTKGGLQNLITHFSHKTAEYLKCVNEPSIEFELLSKVFVLLMQEKIIKKDFWRFFQSLIASTERTKEELKFIAYQINKCNYCCDYNRIEKMLKKVELERLDEKYGMNFYVLMKELVQSRPLNRKCSADEYKKPQKISLVSSSYSLKDRHKGNFNSRWNSPEESPLNSPVKVVESENILSKMKFFSSPNSPAQNQQVKKLGVKTSFITSSYVSHNSKIEVENEISDPKSFVNFYLHTQRAKLEQSRLLKSFDEIKPKINTNLSKSSFKNKIIIKKFNNKTFQ